MKKTKIMATIVFAAMLLFALNSFAANETNKNQPTIGTITVVTTMNAAELFDLQALTGPEVSAVARPDIAANFANTTITVLLENSSSSNANTINKEKRNKNNDVNPIVMTSGDGAYLVIAPVLASSFSTTTDSPQTVTWTGGAASVIFLMSAEASNLTTWVTDASTDALTTKKVVITLTNADSTATSQKL